MRALVGRNGLRLEPQIRAHAAELFGVLDDPALYRYTGGAPPASAAALEARLGRLESRNSPDGRVAWLNWVVRDIAGEVVGYVRATVDGPSAEIAYVIGQRFWRRGYAASATRTMLGELATAYGVTEATATVDDGNAASLALLRKLGFRLKAQGPAVGEATYARSLAGDV